MSQFRRIWWSVALACGCGGSQPQGSAAASGSGSTEAAGASTSDPTNDAGTTDSSASSSSGSSTTTTGAPGGGALAEPVFDPEDPEHVVHLFEDFSGYRSVADIGVAPRPDGGQPWRVIDASPNWDMMLDEPDAYTDTPSLTIHYIAAGDYPGGIDTESWVNPDAEAVDVLVFEAAVRFWGGGVFAGKDLDFNQGSDPSGIGRFGVFLRVSGAMGWDDGVDCDSDGAATGQPVCSIYYSGNGTIPNFPDENPPPCSLYSLCGVLKPSINRVHTTTIPGSGELAFMQNTGWGTGAGLFDVLENYDQRGMGTPQNDGQWQLIKWRLTREALDVAFGHGRIEMWIGATSGDMLKILNYVGDPGQRDAGYVYVDPARPAGSSNMVAGQLSPWNLSGGGNEADSRVSIGYLRAWSHPRQELP